MSDPTVSNGCVRASVDAASRFMDQMHSVQTTARASVEAVDQMRAAALTAGRSLTMSRRFGLGVDKRIIAEGIAIEQAIARLRVVDPDFDITAINPPPVDLAALNARYDQVISAAPHAGSLVVHLRVVDRATPALARVAYQLRQMRIDMNRNRRHSPKIAAMHAEYRRKTKGRRP